MEYYKFYDKTRFRIIRDKKVIEHANNIKLGYNFSFAIVISLILVLPYFQLILGDAAHDFLFKIRQCFILNITSVIICILYYFASKNILPKFEFDDDEKRFRFLSDNQVMLFITLLVLIFLTVFVYWGLDNFMPHFEPTKNNITNLDIDLKIQKRSEYPKSGADSIEIQDIKYKDPFVIVEKMKYEFAFYSHIVNQFVLCIFIVWSMSTFTLLFYSLKSRLERRRNSILKEHEVYVYWLSFIKAMLLENPVIVLSAVLFLTLTSASFILRGNYEISTRHFIYSVAFYSFWFTSLTAVITPFFTKIRLLNATYHNYAVHKLKNSILAGIHDHVIIIGTGNLGRMLINNTLIDIHPEGYESHSLCPEIDNHQNTSVPDVSDYDFIITKDLELQMVSRRLVVIEKEDKHFDAVYDDKLDVKIGTFNLWPRTDLNIVIPGIIGDANKNIVLYESKSDRAQVIVNTTPDSVLSMKLSADYPNKKLILSVNNSNSFDVLTTTTFDKSMYTIDVQQIEGITLSQVIYSWAFSNIRSNLEVPENLRSLRIKLHLAKNQENYSFYQKLVEIINMKDDGKVLIVGNGSYIYYIIQSLWLTMKFTLKLDEQFTKEIIQQKIIVLTEDPKIKDETVKYAFQNNWEFYPIRNKNTWSTLEDFKLEIRTYLKGIKNFDSYLEIFKNHRPELIVLMNDKPYEAVEMFTEASNSIEAMENFDKELKIPQIIVYSYRSDKLHLMELFKKYIRFNKKSKASSGFPSQNLKESRISRDYISANQFASMLRSLYVNKSLPENKEIDEPLAEVTFSMIEKPGALAYTVSKLCGLDMKLMNNRKKIPTFIYYYSTEMRRYRDTFIFWGTAKLEDIGENTYLEDSIRYCFVNCDKKYRKDMESTVINNLGFMPETVEVEDLVNRKFDVGMYTHYPISTMLRHPNKFYDILNRNRRFYINQIPYEKLLRKEESSSKSKTQILGMFNLSDFTVWAEGEGMPGSYARVLAQLVFSNAVESMDHFSEKNYVPQIMFSNNRPSFYTSIKEEDPVVAQDSFYVKLVSKKKLGNLKNDLIRAIKVKLSSNVDSENMEWTEYLFDLKKHLSSLGGDYSIFMIEKIFVEGTNLETAEGIINISFYKEMESFYGKNSSFNDFQIVTRWIENEDRSKDLPLIRFDMDYAKYKNVIKESEKYELVLIRSDIVNAAKLETLNGQKFEKFQNMIFLIDEL